MIPKRIFYIWFGEKKLPQDVLNNIKGWKKLNPDFEVIRIDERNFEINKYNYIKEAYKSGNWAFASDMARLIIIYTYGGFYLDTDVTLIKPLAPLAKFKSVWGLENSNAINSGLILGANCCDNDLENLINIYNKLDFDPNNKFKFVTVKIITNYFIKKGFVTKNRVQSLGDGTVIFSTKYFAPFHWWGGGKISNETIAIQNYSSSWVKRGKEPILQKIILNSIFYLPKYSLLVLRVLKKIKSII